MTLPMPEKVSEVFQRFAQPLLDLFGVPTPDQIRHCLTIAATCWNVVIFEDQGGLTEDARRGLEALRGDARTQQLVNAMKQRKRTEFGEHRWLVDHELVLRPDGEWRLRVAARAVLPTQSRGNDRDPGHSATS
jgi:hypothetical protein